MKTRGQFSKPSVFNYQSHQSLQKFRKVPVEQRVQDITQDIFKIKVKGQPTSKLVVARNSASSKQQQNKQLKKHIKLLQFELKKKILQNPILSKIFKTKNSTNNQLSHIDLFVEFNKMKQEQENMEKEYEEAAGLLKKKQMQYEMEIAVLKQEKQKREQDFILQIQKATQKFQQLKRQYQQKLSQKQKLFQQQTIQRQSKIQDHNMLLQQFKRKNTKLTKQNKDFQTKLNDLKKNQQQRTKSIKLEYETYKQKVESQKGILKQELEKMKQNSRQYNQQKQEVISQLENQIAEKTLQIQQLDRFIELQKQSFQSQIHQQKQLYQQTINQLTQKHQQEINFSVENKEKQIKQIIKQFEGKLSYQKGESEKKYGQYQVWMKEGKKQNQELKNKMKDIMLTNQNLLQKMKETQHRSEIEISQVKQFNRQIIQEKQTLIKKLTSTQLKLQKSIKQLQKSTKQYQNLLYQRNQLHTKYQKDHHYTQTNIKHYQQIIQQLQRKIYFLGNQNTGLKKSLQSQKSSSSIHQNKSKQINKINEQKYQQKYKTLGRIEQIRHKVENVINSDIVTGKGYFNNNSTFNNCINSSSNINNFKSNNLHNNSNNNCQLIESVEELSLVLDKLVQNYLYLNQTIQRIKKQKLQDQREIQSILGHFLDLDQWEDGIEENVRSYIGIRKEISKQSSLLDLHNREEYLVEKKRQLSRFIIEKLIEIKVIKSYSSADQTRSSYKISKPDKPKNNHPTSAYNSVQSSSSSVGGHYLSNVNSRNSRKNFKKLIQQQQYKSNQQNYSKIYKQQNDDDQNYNEIYCNNNSLKNSNKRALFQINEKESMRQRKNSLQRPRQNSRINLSKQNSRANLTKDTLRRNSLIKTSQQTNKNRPSRISTQPHQSDDDYDIQQHSTYQILDQNINYGNFNKKPQQNNWDTNNNYLEQKLQNKKNLNNKNSSMMKNKHDEKLQQQQKYKNQIKQKLLNPKHHREIASSISKQDIEKKYFLR